MLLEFDADQRLWQETVRDAVAKQCPPALVRGVAEDGADPTPVWKAYVAHGWTEMNESETAVELAIVLEELGRATDPTPFLATMTQFAPLAADRFNPQASGAAVYSGVTVHRDGDEWVLDGTARHVLDGDRAQWLAVVTEASVFIVNADDAGAQLSRRRSAVLGVPIGSFQAVQHKAADMHVAVERARALAYYAALTIAADDPRRRLAAVMAKAATGECQSLVFRHGLQLFGAMGFTWENDLQFALKRAKAGELMLGGTAEHRASVTEEYRAAQL